MLVFPPAFVRLVGSFFAICPIPRRSFGRICGGTSRRCRVLSSVRWSGLEVGRRSLILACSPWRTALLRCGSGQELLGFLPFAPWRYYLPSCLASLVLSLASFPLVSVLLVLVVPFSGSPVFGSASSAVSSSKFIRCAYFVKAFWTV